MFCTFLGNHDPLGECLGALKIYNDKLVDLLQKTNIAIPPFAETTLLDTISKAYDPKTTKKINKCHNSSLNKICKIEMTEPEVINTASAYANAKNDIPPMLSSTPVEHSAIEKPTLAIVVISGIVHSLIIITYCSKTIKTEPM